MRSERCLFFIVIALSIAACKQHKEAETTNDLPDEAIFFDYLVRADESGDSVTVLLNYREFNEFGYALKLAENASVSLDGEAIPGTTLKIPGTFYELQKPVSVFSGEHQISYTDKDKKQYVEKFIFSPLVLVTEIPASLPKADLELQFEGLKKGDMVHIVLTDTAYASEGIERTDTVKNDRIMITAEELASLAEGPVQLELVKENIRPVIRNGRIRGKFALYYGLKREFMLGGRPE